MKHKLRKCTMHTKVFFLTHTVQMKQLIVLQLLTRLPDFLTHTVQMKHLYVTFICDQELLLNPHGSDETNQEDIQSIRRHDFLTHTVQMKRGSYGTRNICIWNFLTHTVQMKLSTRSKIWWQQYYFLTHTVQMKQDENKNQKVYRTKLLNPHGSDET